MAEEIWTSQRVLRWTQQRFAERHLASPRLDAEVLLAHLLGCDRVKLYTHFDQPLSKPELAAYRELIKRRLAGEPVAYLTGQREFWSLRLAVDARVLVPRPETELLVEVVLAGLAGRPAPRVVDVGTGSGAIAIALAHERPDAEVFAIDLSPDALAVARANAATHGVAITFLAGDLLSPLAAPGLFDAIVANPPYIAERDFATLPREVQREPRLALLAGDDGLDVIRRLVASAPGRLAVGGQLAIEVGAGQAPAVVERLRAAGLSSLEARRDLAAIERVVSGRR